MKDENEMQKKEDVFAALYNENPAGMDNINAQKNTNAGLDTETFGSAAEIYNNQKTTMYTPDWNEDTAMSDGHSHIGEPPMKEQTGSRALEVCALVFGIISLCGCCYGLFGIVGLVLSIVALAKGKKSGLSIAGLILSVIGILTAIAVIIFNFSAAGQNWREVFIKKFVESTYNDGGNYTTQADTEDDIATEDADGKEDKEFGTDVLADDERVSANVDYDNSSLLNEKIAEVTIAGKQITIPCKFSEIRDEFEISDYNAEDLKKGLDAGDIKFISLASNREDLGVTFSVSNNTDSDLKSIDDGYVTAVWLSDYEGGSVDAKLFRDITTGMDEKTLEAALADINYTKSEENTDTYSFRVGQEFFFFIYLRDGKVSEADLTYYEKEE